MVVEIASSAPTLAPANPAPPIPAYPQFFETSIPVRSGATRAYRGYIRPFSDDATAWKVLRALVAEQPLQVSEGRLDSDAAGLPEHELEAYLRCMAEPCTVVVLEFPGKQHPRAYLVNPLPHARESNNHHTWWHETVLIDGISTPQICVYSANQFTYDPTEERLPQFLNQVSTYLAKHLIFLRTRMLHLRKKDGTLGKVNTRKPWQPINPNLLMYSKKSYLYGTWVGPVAVHGPKEHLLADDPDGECYCNSGAAYRDCHMAGHQSLVGPLDGGNG